MNVPAILWEHSMQCFLAARIAEVEYDDSTFGPACDQFDYKKGQRVPDDIVAEAERLTEARCDAEEALILTPTNDAAKVRWKLAYSRLRWQDFCDFPDDWWEAIHADLERISAGGAA